ncbi:MAG: head-tail connector protein [Clostridia bacterium]|nr:head-tail connector protein [Clostridia bacterium]
MLDRIKQYLGIDFPDDDMMLQSMEQAAYAYLEGAIGKGYDRNDPRAQMLLLQVVADLYNARGTGELSGKASAGTRRMVDNFVLQLRLERGANGV